MNIVTQVIIDRPPNDVWRYLVNPCNLSKWLSGFQRYEPLCGKAGAKGAVAHHHYQDGKRSLVLEETILEREENQRLVTQLTHPMMQSRVTTTLVDLQGQRTEVICEVQTRFNSTLTSWIMSRFMRRTFQKRQDADFARLREVVEEERAPVLQYA